MTVAELIAKLQTMPQEMPIYVYNGQECYSEADEVAFEQPSRYSDNKVPAVFIYS